MRVRLLVAGLALGCVAAAGGQTLARKNWAGSGISVEPWYQSAVFYQIDPLTFQDSNGDGFGDLAGITARLGYLEQLGVDAIVLSPLPLEPGGGQTPFDPAYGSAEDFDTLEREATAHHVRVLVDVAVEGGREQRLATARFWLSRGVAGLRVVGEAPERAQVLRELRELAGSRILISDTAEVAVASRHPLPRVAPQVQFDRRLMGVGTLTPALLRAALAGTNLIADLPNVERSITRLGDGAQDGPLAKITAAALLLGRGAPMIYFGQELGTSGAGDPTPMQWGGEHGFTSGVPWIAMGPNAASANVEAENKDAGSLLNWYRGLAKLHHAEAFGAAAVEVLPVPNAALVAWLRRSRGGAAVLVVANFSAYPMTVAVSSLVPGRAGRIKVLARSAGEAGGEGSAVALEGYGVWVGELSGAGLEAVAVPARTRRR